jgi:hypothetical protein
LQRICVVTLAVSVRREGFPGEFDRTRIIGTRLIKRLGAERGAKRETEKRERKAHDRGEWELARHEKFG